MAPYQPEDVHAETWAVISGRPAAAPGAPLNVPPVLASTFTADGEWVYGRYGNPIWAAFEEAIGGLEGGHAVVFGSGMAAISAVLERVPVGGVVVAPNHAYTGTLAYLDQRAAAGRLRVVRVNAGDTAGIIAALGNADLLWLESPTNPLLEVADLATVLPKAKAAGVFSVVDNTFATPMHQRPLTQGADVVVHSATKYISGHSDVVLGVAIAADAMIAEQIATERKLSGNIASPFDVFLALRGLRTLPLRYARAGQTAADLAARLTGHPALTQVIYPGFGAVISVVLDSPERAAAFIRGCSLWHDATSLGGAESTMERRRRWPAEATDVPEGLVRLSVGLEHADDLYRDLTASLAKLR